MKSFYTKTELNKIKRSNSFNYRLSKNIARKYGSVYAVAWSNLDEEGNPIAVGSSSKEFHKEEDYGLKSFIHHYSNVLGYKISFAKCYNNLPLKSWI